MFLTADEIRDLTGKRRSDAQRRALEHMRVPYRARPDGTLAVLRAHVEAIPGATIATTPREPELHL